MNTVSRLSRPALRKLYAVAGRSLCLEAADDGAARPFERIFDGWNLHPYAEGARPAADATITVHQQPPPPLTPARLETFETELGWRCHTDEITYSLEGKGFAVRARAGEAAVDVWLGSSGEVQVGPVALARLVFEATCAAWRRCGLFDIHAAACIEPLTGAGLLFAGPSGSGKSTLTTRLAARGWRYLSDDSLLLAETEGRVEAWGVRRAFALTESALAWGGLPRLKEAATEPAPFDPLKRRFQPREVFPEGFAEKCAPRVLFFTALTHERETRCLELSQHEAMSRLLRMCPWSCYDRPAARGYVSALAALARQSVPYELLAGTDLLGDLDYTAAYVAARARVS